MKCFDAVIKQKQKSFETLRKLSYTGINCKIVDLNQLTNVCPVAYCNLGNSKTLTAQCIH